MIPFAARSVMASRREPPDSLDFFPTPPFATRSLIAHGLMPRLWWTPEQKVWEPACGEGHMSEVLREFFSDVYATDIFDYGTSYQDHVADFLGDMPGDPSRYACDWVITNPPFNAAEEFLNRALTVARYGVAFLVRSQFLEGAERYRRIFLVERPTLVLQFCERVPMKKGEWDPNGSTATAYCWIVWRRGYGRTTEFDWIPPGQRQALTRPGDVERFAPAAPIPLFEGSGT